MGHQALELSNNGYATARAGTLVEGKSYRASVALFARLDVPPTTGMIRLLASEESVAASSLRLATMTPQRLETCFVATAELANQPLHVKLEVGPAAPYTSVTRVLFDNVQVEVSDAPCQEPEVSEETPSDEEPIVAEPIVPEEPKK